MHLKSLDYKKIKYQIKKNQEIHLKLKKKMLKVFILSNFEFI